MWPLQLQLLDPPVCASNVVGLYSSELVMGHFFKTQPNPKLLDLTQANQPTKVFTRPNPTHHQHLVNEEKAKFCKQSSRQTSVIKLRKYKDFIEILITRQKLNKKIRSD